MYGEVFKDSKYNDGQQDNKYIEWTTKIIYEQRVYTMEGRRIYSYNVDRQRYL
jgi:hypothetical protein